MKKIKYVIVDDERLARVELQSLLKVDERLESVGEASNSLEAIDLINSLNPDLVFLDIQMPGMTGIEMLKQLKVSPHIVFTTAFDEYAMKAFEVDAMDYILKPIDPERLAETLKRVKTQDDFETTEVVTPKDGLLGLHDKVFLKDGEKCFFIEVGRIREFKSEGNYIIVNFDNEKIMLLSSLNAMEERLEPKMFFRANRQYLVNVNYIQNVEIWFNGGYRLTMSNGDRIEISRRQSVKFKEMFEF